ncbi:MAG TPA: acetyl-CoA C-acyltransferase [Chitinophagales bacterium]|nr:acetyl-CoA C-acyltransferase [Chitinophagales bacterium]
MEAYIIAGSRTAIGKAKRGGFRFTTPVDMAYHAITDLLKKVPNLDPKLIDDLIVGNAVPEAEQGLQMARWVAVRSLPVEVPGVSVNRYCGSGIEVIALATAKIKAGMADVIIAGGTESMSLVPTVGYKTVPNYEIAKDHPDYYIGMGLTAENVATKYGISREAADEFSVNSHKKAMAAIEAGKFAADIVPVEIEEVYFEGGKKKSRKFTVSQDEGPRADTSMEGLGKLKPAFKAGGQVTAGNSSQTSDAAAFVLVVSERFVKEHNLQPIARMITSASVGVDPTIMGIGPVAAIPKALKQAGLKLNDLDLIELNEAFAAQSLAVIKEAGLNTDIINVNGGAVALGHPLGASGTYLFQKLIGEMQRRNNKYGMVSACIGGGQGIAGIFERL